MNNKTHNKTHETYVLIALALYALASAIGLMFLTIGGLVTP
jgi:hypothetical protein